MYIHIDTYIHVHTYIHTYIHTYVVMYIQIHKYLHTYIHIHTYILVWHSHTLRLEEEGSGNSSTNELWSLAGIPTTLFYTKNIVKQKCEIECAEYYDYWLHNAERGAKISDMRVHEWQRCFYCVTNQVWEKHVFCLPAKRL